MKKSASISWSLFIGLVFLGGCKATGGSISGGKEGDSGEGEKVELTAVDLSLDGTTTGQVADGETSVEIANLSATEYVRQVVIDLGAHFLPANICSGKTIFGRLGLALCPEEITAASAFRSTGSLSMKNELAAGECSNDGNPVAAYTTRATCEKADVANVWTPTAMTGERIATTTSDTTARAGADRNAATVRYDGTAWVQADIPAATGDGWVADECGKTGNIEARIAGCNRQWRATLGSKAGGGTWSLVTRMSGHEVWRDEKTGLIWSDKLSATGDHCEATGDDAGVANCNGTFTKSFCAETGFSNNYTAVDEIEVVDATGFIPDITAYGSRKGEMGLNSDHPVLWRLPTLQDFTTAYGNGMAYVLPNLGSFWTASVDPSVTDYAMYFVVGSGGYVESNYAYRYNTSYEVRCVGR